MSSIRRIIFCTYSSIYSSQVLTLLLQSKNIEIVGIVNSTRVLKPSYNTIMASFKLIQFTGWRYSTYLFFITDFFALLQPITRLKTVRSLANNHHIPLLNTVDINDANGIKFVSELAPDIVLSAHFNQLIKEPILKLPKLTSINIHPSLLPNYKGVDPVFYALLANEKKIGVTAHLMDKSFDTGKVLTQRSLTVDSTQTVFSQNILLFKMGGEIALDAIYSIRGEKSDIGLDSIELLNTDSNLRHYDSWPNSKLVKLLRLNGRRLLSLRHFFSYIRQH